MPSCPPSRHKPRSKPKERNYVGAYVSTDQNLNASVTIAFNKSTVPSIGSGLTITSWFFNGTDVLAGALFKGKKPRLEPSISKQTSVGTPGQVGFQASVNVQTLTYMAAMEIPNSGVIGTWTGFYATNEDFVFLEPGNRRSGGVSANMFVFDVDEEGKATACSPAVDRVTLKRKTPNGE